MSSLQKGIYNKMKYKFRAYNKTTQTMIVLDPLQWPLCALNEEENWKVMMWTGLLDRSGKEIYEGDIFKNSLGKIGQVVFSHIGNEEGWTGFWVTYPNTKSHWPIRANQIEIIGNIHSNPELLEKGV